MIEQQNILPATPATLVDLARERHVQGWRLVQICATTLGDTMQLDYAFDRHGTYEVLRLSLPSAAPRLASISGVYWAAFIYENELHDLFGIEVEGMAIDFKGTFYKTMVKYPFSAKNSVAPSVTATVVTPAPAPVSAPVPVPALSA